jgi:hypothetical protein
MGFLAVGGGGGGGSSTTTAVSNPSPSLDVVTCCNSEQTADLQKLLQAVSNFGAVYCGLHDANRAESGPHKIPLG